MYVIRIASCTLYKVAVVKGLQGVKYIIYPSLVDDSNAFVIGYVSVTLVEGIYIEHIWPC